MPALKYKDPADGIWKLVPVGTGGLDQAAADARYVNVAGDTMSGLLSLSGDPTAALHAVTKRYADQPATYRGTASADITVPNGAETGIGSTNNDYQQRGITRSGATFTVAAAGLYVASVSGALSASPGSGRAFMNCIFSGTNNKQSFGNLENYIGAVFMQGLNANGTIVFRVYQSSGASMSFQMGAYHIVRVGDL